MGLCIYCSSIDLLLLWASKQPHAHQPSLLALTISAEDCSSCEVFLNALPDRIHHVCPVPTLLTRVVPLMLVTANGYKYNRTITDEPIKIDCLGVYFDGQEEAKDQGSTRRTKADPKYFCSWLDVYATHASLAASSGVVGRIVPSTPDFNHIRAWLGECRKSHSLCSTQPDFDQIPVLKHPSYLIDVLSQRLVESSEIDSSTEYLTLSHRWHKDMITTTNKSLSKHMKRLPVDSLSQCFKDALDITKLCGFQYIWIDALCIIQDSVSHLQQECSRMKDIYRNCCIMLAADSIQDKTRSLYPSRREPHETKVPFQAGSTSHSTQLIIGDRELGYFGSDVVQSILSTRGWTLQERVLAPRILHFGKRQLYWECGVSIWCEKNDYTLPYHDTPILDEVRDIKIESSTSRFSHSSRKSAGISEGVTKHTQWYDTVSAYSCRHLSHGEDKLPAVGGIADLFQAKVRDEYVWGLWRHDIPAGLLWSVKAADSAKRLPAPLWSWASIDGELTFYIPSTKWGRPLQGTLQVTCDEVLLSDSACDSYEYPNGRISCCCPIQKVAVSETLAFEDDDEYPFDHLTKQPNAAVCFPASGQYIGYAIIDDELAISTYTTQNSPLHALMLYQSHSVLDMANGSPQRQEVTQCYCILLEQLGSSDLFIRRGYAEIKLGAFAEAERRTVSII